MNQEIISNLTAAPTSLRMQLKDCLRYPTERNVVYFAGYLKGMLDAGALSDEGFWMAFAGQISDSVAFREDVAEVLKSVEFEIDAELQNDLKMELISTGGGCEAWTKGFGETLYVMLTDETGSSARNLKASEGLFLGFYKNDQDHNDELGLLEGDWSVIKPVLCSNQSDANSLWISAEKDGAQLGVAPLFKNEAGVWAFSDGLDGIFSLNSGATPEAQMMIYQEFTEKVCALAPVLAGAPIGTCLSLRVDYGMASHNISITSTICDRFGNEA